MGPANLMAEKMIDGIIGPAKLCLKIPPGEKGGFNPPLHELFRVRCHQNAIIAAVPALTEIIVAAVGPDGSSAEEMAAIMDLPVAQHHGNGAGTNGEGGKT